MNKLLDEHYRNNYQNLVKRMYSRLGCMEDAEDVVQNAYVNALKYFRSYNPAYGLDGWFSGILNNCCKQFHSSRFMGGLTKNIDECHDELEPVIPSHISDITVNELRQIAFNKPGEYGRVLIFNLQFGYTPKEITEITGINTKKVSNYLTTFTKEMKERYV